MQRVDGHRPRTWLVECFSTAAHDGGPPAGGATAPSQSGVSSADAACLAIVAIPGDEVSFYLFEAPDEIAVRRAASTAGLRLERVVECRVTSFSRWDPARR